MNGRWRKEKGEVEVDLLPWQGYDGRQHEQERAGATGRSQSFNEQSLRQREAILNRWKPFNDIIKLLKLLRTPETPEHLLLQAAAEPAYPAPAGPGKSREENREIDEKGRGGKLVTPPPPVYL